MSKTNYPGIDYSGIAGAVANTNRDAETGIRYGVICQNSLNHNATEDIWQNGTDLSFEGYKDEIKAGLRRVLQDIISDYKSVTEAESELDAAVSDAWDAVEQDCCDNYQSDSPQMRYEAEGYVIQTCSDNDFFVFKSPYFTFAQFCSPCVPGACNLDSPLEGYGMTEEEKADKLSANKCYCFGHEWFEANEHGKNRAPYPVYSVETGKEVEPE